MSWQARDVFDFTAPLPDGTPVTHPIHVGGSGPPMLLMQELPGIGPETLDLCARLNAAGFTTYLPHMLGAFGRKTLIRNTLRLLCIRREFNMFLKGAQSPVAAWMRALVADIQRREAGGRVGVIGMCLTGSFAIPLLAEDAVCAAVASQPALPFRAKGTLHMSSDDIAKTRAAMAEKGPALALRYEKDSLVPDDLWQAFQSTFKDGLETTSYPGKAHSLLTIDFHSDAYAKLETYFQARLT